MKKIIVEKTPPAPATSRIVTQLTGKELVAYVTETGYICLLHQSSRDFKDRERYGFFNLAYSASSSPTFAAGTWFEAIKLAGVTRELFAFDNYQELIQFVAKTPVPYVSTATKEEATRSSLQDTRAKFHDTRAEYYKDIMPERMAHIATPLKLEDMDLNGAGQINHTHRNITSIFKKVNELADAINLGYTRNKARIFEMSLSETKPSTKCRCFTCCFKS